MSQYVKFSARKRCAGKEAGRKRGKKEKEKYDVRALLLIMGGGRRPRS